MMRVWRDVADRQDERWLLGLRRLPALQKQLPPQTRTRLAGPACNCAVCRHQDRDLLQHFDTVCSRAEMPAELQQTCAATERV